MLVRNSPKLHTVAFAEALLALAAEVAGESGEEALELLDAFEILADLPAFDASVRLQAEIAELSALALVRRANAMFKLGRFRDAALILRIGQQLEFTTIEAAGEFHEAKARLAAVQQEVGPALAELAIARELYASIEDSHLVGRVLVAEGFVYGESRQFEKSIEALGGALERIDAARDRRLALAACVNIARALRDAGRTYEALEAIALTRTFVASTARKLDRLHIRWLEAGLFADHADFSTAAAIYKEVASGFGAEGLIFELSEVALEAVEAFSRAGRGRELVPLLTLAERAFRSQGLTEERIAAWFALRRQLVDDVATAAAVAAARSVIERARS